MPLCRRRWERNCTIGSFPVRHSFVNWIFWLLNRRRFPGRKVKAFPESLHKTRGWKTQAGKTRGWKMEGKIRLRFWISRLLELRERPALRKSGKMRKGNRKRTLLYLLRIGIPSPQARWRSHLQDFLKISRIPRSIWEDPVSF